LRGKFLGPYKRQCRAEERGQSKNEAKNPEIEQPAAPDDNNKKPRKTEQLTQRKTEQIKQNPPNKHRIKNENITPAQISSL